jgi:hypothetical protein
VQHAIAALGGADEDLRVFTAGDGALRDLQLSVLPEATHVLDWYHLTRWLTVLASVINVKEAAEKLPARDQDRLSEWDGLREVAPVARPRGRGHHPAAVNAGRDGKTFFEVHAPRRGCSDIQPRCASCLKSAASSSLRRASKSRA